MGGPVAGGWDVPQQVQVVKETSYWWIPIAVAIIGALGGIIKVLLGKKKKDE